MSVSQMAPPAGNAAGVASPEDILARIERLPLSSWQIKTRIVVGTATFFDAFDALSIAYVLPAIVPMWKLTPSAIGWLISAGFAGLCFSVIAFVLVLTATPAPTYLGGIAAERAKVLEEHLPDAIKSLRPR